MVKNKMEDITDLTEEIEKNYLKIDLDKLKSYLDKRDFKSTNQEYRDETLIIMRDLLNSNKFEVVKFVLDYFPKEFLKVNDYFLNDLNDSKESFEIFKYLYNYYEKNIIKNNIQAEILFGAFNSSEIRDLRIVKFLFEEKGYNINLIPQYKFNAKIKFSSSVLIGAVMIEDIDKIKYILEETNFNLINFQDNKSKTALFYATKNFDIFELLLVHGIDPEIKDNARFSVENILEQEIEEKGKFFSSMKFEKVTVRQVKDILNKLEKKSSQIKKEDVYFEANELNLNPQMVSKIINRLKRRGEIYEPRKGIYQFLEFC